MMVRSTTILWEVEIVWPIQVYGVQVPVVRKIIQPQYDEVLQLTIMQRERIQH
jgi:hypothetical protein